MTALLQERPAGIRNLRAREFRAILRTLAFDPEFLSFRASLEGRTPVELAQGGTPLPRAPDATLQWVQIGRAHV